MKKLLALALAAILMLSLAATSLAQSYEVTEPITIQWWHAHEDQYKEQIKYMVDRFHEQYPLLYPLFAGGGQPPPIYHPR